jgi:hypothetical protein
MSLTRAQLPVRLTPLVGRARELGDVVDALNRGRLITLTGPGGAGKTRLALAAAQTAVETFPAGVYWVALAQINDAAIVGQSIATQLGVPIPRGRTPPRRSPSKSPTTGCWWSWTTASTWRGRRRRGGIPAGIRGVLVGFYTDGAGNTDGMIATPRG